MTSTFVATLCTALVWLNTFDACAAERPNVVVIMVDDLGFSDVGCYPRRRDRTELKNLAQTEPERLNGMIKKWRDMSLKVIHSPNLAEMKMKPTTNPRKNPQWTVFGDAARTPQKNRKRAGKQTEPAEAQQDALQFSRRDTNKDGKISFAEFADGAKRDTDKLKAMFKKRDTNNDGFLTVEDDKK